MSTQDIHTILPDGSGDRVLWTNPGLSDMNSVYSLAWRPDGRVLAFSSQHEEACSWFQSDVYAIGYNGAGYRRVTNSPACAVLPSLPQGSVKVYVRNYTNSLGWVYVQGAPGIESFLAGFIGWVTFDEVADFGQGVYQPSIGIGGLDRFTSYPPYADVQPGETVEGGDLTVTEYSGFRGFGAGKVSWKADGSALAYGMRSSSGITQIAVNPHYGATGVDLPVVEDTAPSLVAWGPTDETRDQYLYYSGMNVLVDGVTGVYLNTVGDAGGGTQLVQFENYDGRYIFDIQWLPDASGFLFSMQYSSWDPIGTFANIFEYDFATQEITRLTDLPNHDFALGLSISPDGQQIVFERAPFPDYSPVSLWIVDRVPFAVPRKLADDAGGPAWGPVPPPLTPRAYLPLVVR
jgi:TolB protein